MFHQHDLRCILDIFYAFEWVYLRLVIVKTVHTVLCKYLMAKSEIREIYFTSAAGSSILFSRN